MHIDTINNTVEYAGDIDPKTAWSILESYNDSLLVDVRTQAELNYVEAREQFARKVLESNDYYNGHIRVRVHGKGIMQK